MSQKSVGLHQPVRSGTSYTAHRPARKVQADAAAATALPATGQSDDQLQSYIDYIPNLAWMADPNGNVYWYNKRWYEYTGITPHDMAAHGWQSAHDPKALPKVLKQWEACRTSGEPFVMTFPIRGADTVFRPFLTRMVPIKNPDDTIRCWIGTATDISEQVGAEDALRQSERRIQAIFDAVIDCITVFDMQGNVVMMNSSAAAVYGIKGGGDILEGMEHAVETYEMYYMDGRRCPFEDWPISRIYRGEQLTDYQLRGKRANPDLERYLSFTGSLVKDDDGKPQYAVVVTRDITDKLKAEEEEKQLAEMARERNELLQLNRAKDDFISIASHQLRTPATAVKQYIGILQSGIGGALTPDQQRFLTIANESNERQLRLINDLLKTAQIDADRFTLHRQKHDIRKLVADIIADLEPTVSQKQQRIILHDSHIPIVLSIDTTEMKVALANVVENASKYSPASSQVDVSIAKAGKHVTITVKDSGVGIAREDQGKIFDKFSRVNSRPHDSVPGTGLGLYLVKQIVELHGGTVAVRSALHKGSEFKISLPYE